MNLKLSKLQLIIYKVMRKTYIKALRKATPGDGETRDNWDVRMDGKDIIIFNTPTGDNIRFTNDGTEAHIIRAKPGKYLRFKVDKKKPRKSPYKKIPGNQAFEKDGYVFAKAVNHPGIEARHYIEKILADKTIEKEARIMLEEEVGKLLSQIK